ncbi:hypothetical protein JCM11251_003758 [Rhodosporidiobolus azoricus]
MAPNGTIYDPDQDFDAHPDFPHVQTKTYVPQLKEGEAALIPKQPVIAPTSRAIDADPSLPNLLKSGVVRLDLTPSIGTELLNVQLANLNDAGRDELALLVAQRGVVFFRAQEISDAQQGSLFNYFDRLEDVPLEQAGARVHDIKEFGKSDSSSECLAQSYPSRNPVEADYRQTYTYYPWKFADAHADGSFQVNPPSLSLLKITDIPAGGGGDTVWTSQYGLYDSLSPALQAFFSTLKAVHTSQDIFEAKSGFEGRTLKDPPIDTHHPLVITHPVTGWRALYYNSNFVRRIAGTKYYESQALEHFLTQHIDSAQDQQVRFRLGQSCLSAPSYT